MQAESSAVEHRLVALVTSGTAPDSAAGQEVAEDHRRHIERWYYDVPHAMHVGIGRMYVDDERFSAHYEALAPGAAAWGRDAIAANAIAANAATRQPGGGGD